MKLIVVIAGGLALLAAAQARAQTPGGSGAPQRPEPFVIIDNSFLIEEAFNQDPGVVQNIFTWTSRRDGNWAGNFTQEWPLGGVRHQISYTLPFSGGDVRTRVDSVQVNYRFQVLEESATRPALAPRFTVILPARDHNELEGADFQVNAPFSKQVGDFYLHWSSGLTWRPGVPAGIGTTRTLTTPEVAGSVVWRAAPRFHLMLEQVVDFAPSLDDVGSTERNTVYTVSPGFRTGWNIGDQQIVVGAAIPIIVTASTSKVAVLTYFSYELPFRKIN